MQGPPSGSTEANEAEKHEAPRPGAGLHAVPPLDTRDWPDELVGKVPREILIRIVESDCLQLFQRSQSHLHEQHYLLDSQRLADRTAAVAAYRAARDGPTMKVDAFLEACLVDSVQQLIEQDHAHTCEGTEVPAVHEVHFEFLSSVLGIPAERARGAAVAFNALPAEVRRTFFLVAIDHRPEDEAVKDGDMPAEQFAANLKRALLTLSLARDPELGDFHA